MGLRMGIFNIFKERKGALPPPPPPTMEGLPPLPSLELEAPPEPTMPTPPKPEELPMELPPLPQYEPREVELKGMEAEIPIIKAEAQTMEDNTSPFIEDNEPTVVHDKTLTQPTYKESMPQPPRRVKPVMRKEEGSAFVSVSDYETIMESIGTIQHNIEETEQHLVRMTELSNTEEKVLDQWRNHLEDMEKKLSYVDQIIFEGE